KHAAVGLAEWLAITYGDRGIGVSVLCPQAVRTGMTDAGAAIGDPGLGAARVDGMSEPEEVAAAAAGGRARAAVPALSPARGRKAGDYDRWLAGMQRFQKRLGFVGPIP